MPNSTKVQHSLTTNSTQSPELSTPQTLRQPPACWPAGRFCTCFPRMPRNSPAPSPPCHPSLHPHACPPAEKPKQGAKRAADGKKKEESSEEEESEEESEEVGGCAGWLARLWMCAVCTLDVGVTLAVACRPCHPLPFSPFPHSPTQKGFPTVALIAPLHRTSPLQEEEEEEEKKPAAKKQKAADGSAVDVSAANGSRTIFMKNLAWAADEVRALY